MRLSGMQLGAVMDGLDCVRVCRRAVCRCPSPSAEGSGGVTRRPRRGAAAA